ncbi:MAG: SAM-dependent chlorinase/fluorinase [Planctomycetia bacterium]|nr:SAM-dependent chlorinase/fluorinase [Planctomycetia bacterium]
MMILTLTTDFGVSSPYVAAMKGVLLSVCPDVTVVDITHAIMPQDMLQAGRVLRDTVGYFPDGTLHVAVVDPGVGSERKILYAEIGSQRFLVPDNGLLTPLEQEPERCFYVENRSLWRREVSSTFHGRDIFAPVAGWLALGGNPEELGSVCRECVRLPLEKPRVTAEEITGRVVSVDTFGNLATNLPGQILEKRATVWLENRRIGTLSGTYADRESGEWVAIRGSNGFLEIAVVNGSAADAMKKPAIGLPVRVVRREEPGNS